MILKKLKKKQKEDIIEAQLKKNRKILKRQVIKLTSQHHGFTMELL